MRLWEYDVDPSRRVWTLYVEDADLTSYTVAETRYDHRLTKRVQADAKFIVDACNEKEQREFDGKQICACGNPVAHICPSEVGEQ